MDRIQLRRDSSARWAEVNPILLEGEVGFETDTKLRKIGDGVHRWNELDYLRAEGIVQESGDGENVVMSQKAVSEKIGEVEAEVNSVSTDVDFVRSIKDNKLHRENYEVTSIDTPFLSTNVIINQNGATYYIYIKADYVGRVKVYDVANKNRELLISKVLDFTNGQVLSFYATPMENGRLGFLIDEVTTLYVIDVWELLGIEPLQQAIEDVINEKVGDVNGKIDNIEKEVFTEYTEDDIKWVEGVTINNNVVVSESKDKTSLPFTLKKGATINVLTQGDGNFFFSVLSQVDLHFYPSIGSSAIQSLITITSNNLTSYTYTATEDTIVSVSVRNSEYTKVEIIGNRISNISELEKIIKNPITSSYNRLEGLKWCACGDSFTFGDMGNAVDGSIDEEGKYKGEKANYPNIIGNRYNMDIVLNAKNGWRMVTTGGSGFSSDYGGGYYAIPNDCDLITLAFGLNELNAYGGLSYAEGDVDSTDAETVRGAWNKVIKHILTNMPNARLGVIIMDGWMSSIYSNILKDICQSWGVPYLELFSRADVCLIVPHEGEEYQKAPFSNLNADASSIRKALYDAGNDHPSKYANYARANLIAEWLKTL